MRKRAPTIAGTLIVMLIIVIMIIGGSILTFGYGTDLSTTQFYGVWTFAFGCLFAGLGIGCAERNEREADRKDRRL